MALFVIRHQHPAERCPATDPQMGQMLLNHLSAGTAAQHGVTLHGEAVIDGQHTLYVIAESENRGQVEDYMKPFGMAGTVEVMPASSCAAVVERRGCSG
ncbi:MAG TPA: DUF3303 family protein [Chloroflexota bacterium]|nr:DUF3303 family protein [Chloroflexota bacterium]